MGRRASTSTSSARNNESDPTSANADDSAPDATAAQGTGEPPKTRRKRGPNKPKPGTFTVETKARMGQEEIIKLLAAHAATQLSTDVASNMTLQISIEGVLHPLDDVLPEGATIQFATTIKADE